MLFQQLPLVKQTCNSQASQPTILANNMSRLHKCISPVLFRIVNVSMCFSFIVPEYQEAAHRSPRCRRVLPAAAYAVSPDVCRDT